VDINQLIEMINPDIYENLKCAVERGKWADGVVLTTQQKEFCLQAIIAYDLKHTPEQERVGYVQSPKPTPCEPTDRGTPSIDSTETEDQPVRWRDR
tara:strand:- start:2538 stop:2825 length:288 start_codon:yes stop_codon:yes gene_type:complete